MQAHGARQRTLLSLPNKTSEAAEVLLVSPVRVVTKSVVPIFVSKPSTLTDFGPPLYNVWKQQVKTDGRASVGAHPA
jgi:hypothetical protein